MAENSKISWTHHTFNPWIGCTKVSPGCKFCYAETFSGRYLGIEWGNKPRYLTADSTWRKPYTWQLRAMKNKTRYRVFCASLADVFEDNSQLSEWRKRLWQVIEETPNLDWLLLTKRPENYLKFFPERWKSDFPQNIWLGCSICDQLEYNSKWLLLKQTQKYLSVKVSFVSFEPLLGPINMHMGAPDWTIIGGESGFLKYARPMDLRWVKSIIAQIQAMDNPGHIFFKQMGVHLAKACNMKDWKGESSIDELPEAYDWLKIREVPSSEFKVQSLNSRILQPATLNFEP